MDSRTYSIQARSVPLLQRRDLALLSGTASPESDTAVRRTRTSTYATDEPERDRRETSSGRRRRRMRESRADAEPARRRSRAERADSELPRRERRSEPLRESVSAHMGESTVVSVSRRSERRTSGRMSGFTLVPEMSERPAMPEPRVTERPSDRRRRFADSAAYEFERPTYGYGRDAYPYEETYPFAGVDAEPAYDWRDERATRTSRLAFAEDDWSAPRGISGSQRRREAVREGLMTVPRAAVSLGELALRHIRVMALLVVMVTTFLMLYAPLRDLYIAHRRLDHLQATYAVLEAENKDLNHQLAVLQTREGIENEARARGFVEAGETKVIVEGLPNEEGAAPTTASSLTEVDVVEQLPWYIEALDSFFVYEPED